MAIKRALWKLWPSLVAATLVANSCSKATDTALFTATPVTEAAGLSPLSQIDAALVQDYERVFAQKIYRPASFACGDETITTTAFLRLDDRFSKILAMYTSADGATVIRTVNTSSGQIVRTPAGTFRVLVVILRYPDTFTDDALSLWQDAQRAINEDHASFARSKGYAAPIVVFNNTNLVLDSTQVADPRSLAGITAALQLQNRSTTGYDIVVSLNLDPARSEGGFDNSQAPVATSFIYMGNFGAGRFKAPLTSSDFVSIAGAVYMHEVSHLWGWPASHDWTRASCPGPEYGSQYDGGATAFLPPVLFGWEDVDGDGIPEILDSTPYGRSHP